MEIRDQHATDLLAQAKDAYKVPLLEQTVRDLRLQAEQNGLKDEMDVRHFLVCGEPVLQEYGRISAAWKAQLKAFCNLPELTKPKIDLMWEVVKNKMHISADSEVMHFLATSLIAGRYQLADGSHVVIMVNAPDQASRIIAQEMASGAYQELSRFAAQEARAAAAKWAVDIGGNQGYVSALMAGLFRNTSLVTVELVPTNLVYILFNMILNGFAAELRNDAVPSEHPALHEQRRELGPVRASRELHIVNCAMSDGTLADVKVPHNPKRIFHSNLWADFTPKENRTAAPNGTAPMVLVPACTLPELLSQRKIDYLDVLKIDCEGCEYVAVPSWPDTLLRNVGFVLGELHGSQVGIVGKAGLKKREGLELRKDVDGKLMGKTVTSSTFRTFGVDREQMGLNAKRDRKSVV